MRTVPRRLEKALWSGPTESEWRVSSFGTLSGLTLAAGQEKTWQAIPYGLAMVDEDGNSDFEVGGDLRWRPSSSLGADLTVNPDFALIEADVEVINLTRFELYIPEKRPFFLEGNEMYSQRIRQFYSRRIGDITWGGKAVGTVGKTNFSAIATSEDGVTDESGADRPSRLRRCPSAANPTWWLHGRIAGHQPPPQRRRPGLGRPRHHALLHRDTRAHGTVPLRSRAHRRRRSGVVHPPRLR